MQAGTFRTATTPAPFCLMFGMLPALTITESVDVKALQNIRRHAMTVLLVLATFAIFLTIDYFYSKAKHPVVQVAPAISRKVPATAPQKPNLVGGFAVPDNLRYHPGHT